MCQEHLPLYEQEWGYVCADCLADLDDEPLFEMEDYR